MTYITQIVHGAASDKFALAGRAPICWLNDLTHEVSKIGSLRLAGAWIEPLIKMSPALRDGPLFGTSIAELVEAVITKSADDAARQARPRRRDSAQAAPARANRADLSGKRNRSTGDSLFERSYADRARPLSAAKAQATPAQPRNKRDRLRPQIQPEIQPGIGDSTGRSFSESYDWDKESGQARQTRAAEVGELPQRAVRELLESRANARQQVQHGSGEPQSPAGAPMPRSSPTAPSKADADSSATKRNADQRRAAAPLHAPQSRASTKRRDPFNAISQRRVRANERSSGETFSQRLVRRAGNTIRRLGFSIDGEPKSSESLAEQWSTPLAGASVPGDWLRGIAAGETGAMSGTRSKSEPKPSSPAAAHHQTGAPQSPDESSVTRVNSVDEYSPSSGKRPETRAPNSPGDSFGESFGDRRDDSESTANRGGFERIAPPSLAASLTALSPSTGRQTAVTGVLPLASETARQGAREEASPPEDLDALAAKIKFILDEQARRHGIDV